MFKVFVLAVFFSAVKCAIHPMLTHRGIVGGTVLPRNHRHTYLISLRRSGQHCCGGSIISSRMILTAAHCIYNSHGNLFSVVVGITSQTDVGHTYLPKIMGMHSDYNPNNHENDIAVIITKKEIVFSDRVQPIPLYTSFFEDGRECTATGWGYIKHEGPASVDLRELQTKTISNEECVRRHGSVGPVLVHKHLCTLKCVGQSVCMGDSGGPLTADSKLVGLVSWGRKCASGYPDVFTRISYYTDWIKAIELHYNNL